MRNKKKLEKKVIGGIAAIVASTLIGYKIITYQNQPKPANYQIIKQYQTELSAPYNQNSFSNFDEITLNGIKYKISLSNDKKEIDIKAKGIENYIKNTDETQFSGLDAIINKEKNQIEIIVYKRTAKDTYKVSEYVLKNN